MQIHKCRRTCVGKILALRICSHRWILFCWAYLLCRRFQGCRKMWELNFMVYPLRKSTATHSFDSFNEQNMMAGIWVLMQSPSEYFARHSSNPPVRFVFCHLSQLAQKCDRLSARTFSLFRNGTDGGTLYIFYANRHICNFVLPAKGMRFWSSF